jgi:hypothetical protein
MTIMQASFGVEAPETQGLSETDSGYAEAQAAYQVSLAQVEAEIGALRNACLHSLHHV